MVTVITYDHPHRKTQDLLWKLMLNGYSNIQVVAVPYEERKNFVPLYQHRPSKCDNVSVRDMCDMLNIPLVHSAYRDLGLYLRNADSDFNLIGGAGIISKDVTDRFKIINSHPGDILFTRGLDALKWAIYNNTPIGVTVHYITDSIDNGDILLQRFVPVYFEDTFHSVAQRQYEMEISMLVESIGAIACPNENNNIYPVNKRMPHHIERIMMERFKQIRIKSPSYIQ
jgi:methionyl-tRNA formyltransferase